MNEPVDRVQDLLHEAAETHHQVFRITDGADEDWASWYADWLTNHSELPELLGRRPVRSELTHYLVGLDKEYVAAGHRSRGRSSTRSGSSGSSRSGTAGNLG